MEISLVGALNGRLYRTFDDLMKAVLEIFPNACVEEDSLGQIVIYTDLQLDKDNQIIPFELDE